MFKLNKKGFTLVELLAVIVILGVIMLIAIPSVGTIIQNSRKNSFISSGKVYISSAQNYVADGEIVATTAGTTVDITKVNNGKYDKSPINSDYYIIGTVTVTEDANGNVTYKASICESSDKTTCATDGQMAIGFTNEADKENVVDYNAAADWTKTEE